MRAPARCAVAAFLTGVLIPATGVMSTGGQFAVAGVVVAAWMWAVAAARRDAVQSFVRDARGAVADVVRKRGAR